MNIRMERVHVQGSFACARDRAECGQSSPAWCGAQDVGWRGGCCHQGYMVTAMIARGAMGPQGRVLGSGPSFHWRRQAGVMEMATVQKCSAGLMLATANSFLSQQQHRAAMMTAARPAAHDGICARLCNVDCALQVEHRQQDLYQARCVREDLQRVRCTGRDCRPMHRRGLPTTLWRLGLGVWGPICRCQFAVQELSVERIYNQAPMRAQCKL